MHLDVTRTQGLTVTPLQCLKEIVSSVAPAIKRNCRRHSDVSAVTQHTEIRQANTRTQA